MAKIIVFPIKNKHEQHLLKLQRALDQEFAKIAEADKKISGLQKKYDEKLAEYAQMTSITKIEQRWLEYSRHVELHAGSDGFTLKYKPPGEEK